MVFEHRRSHAQRRAAHPPRRLAVPSRACTSRRRSNHRSEACAAATVHLGSVTRAWKLRTVPRGRGALAGGRTAFPHWLSAPPHAATASAPIP
jgi:hypothetical protein